MSTWSTSRYPTGDSTLVNTSTWYGGLSTYRYDKVDETVVDDEFWSGLDDYLKKRKMEKKENG